MWPHQFDHRLACLLCHLQFMNKMLSFTLHLLFLHFDQSPHSIRPNTISIYSLIIFASINIYFVFFFYIKWIYIIFRDYLNKWFSFGQKCDQILFWFWAYIVLKLKISIRLWPFYITEHFRLDGSRQSQSISTTVIW